MTNRRPQRSDESVTEWIEHIKGGDHTALDSLWQRYFERICHFANRKLGAAKRGAIDEYDLASEALQAI